MLLVCSIVRGKEFEHDLLLLVDTHSEGDRDEDDQADTEQIGYKRAAKRRKQNAGVDSDGARTRTGRS
jgi:hypothetical protein